ncbi:T9SS type A sorting domain-containing protein [Hymenobacter negativus]|uniref:T9SS type A sorting domain-containing protein n=1 Tax=Hymenobacter negativus TaxID=2795026 RepID=A0ABS3QDR3_9BACT|nr:T9SS type A sorting domain-containing protein [Hymenobacter negativus]MBO2009386.1 T9SS type A sorting domain-containing protein [Hymenobacter negativus]
MKPSKLTTIALLLLVVLSTSSIGVARDGRHRGDHHPMGREVRSYVEANVLPVLRQQRQKLEPQLSAADQAQLVAYRAQLRALKELGQALRHSINSSGERPTTRPTLTEAQQKQAHELRSQTHSIMLNVAQMAQKYDGAITQLAQEVQPQKEKWSTDINAIVVKNAMPEQQRMAELGSHRPDHGHLHGPKGLRHFFRPSMFLLMEPTATTTERTLGNTSFYPNPATATSQLEYEVKKAGPVSVDLLDKNGNKLRTLLTEPNAEKGPHTQPLNLSDLPTGTYYYKITTKSGSETKRFVKE